MYVLICNMAILPCYNWCLFHLGPEVDYSRGIGVEESSDEDSDSDIEDGEFT